MFVCEAIISWGWHAWKMGLPGRLHYFGKKRIKKDIAIFIEDLNFVSVRQTPPMQRLEALG
jgi:hypothetical protein